MPVYVLTVILSGHNNDQTKDAIQETHGAPQKEITNQVKSFYRVLFGSLEQFPQPFLDYIRYMLEHHFTRHLPKADLQTVPDVRVISDAHPIKILHIQIP